MSHMLWHKAVTHISYTITRLTADSFSIFEFPTWLISIWAHTCLCFIQLLFPLWNMTSNHRRLNNVFIPDTATGLSNCDAFIPSIAFHPKQALALTEQSVMATFIVRALNRQHMAWAAVSGAKFVPLCSFRGYLWLAPCWLVALLADNGSLCVTGC